MVEHCDHSTHWAQPKLSSFYVKRPKNKNHQKLKNVTQDMTLLICEITCINLFICLLLNYWLIYYFLRIFSPNYFLGGNHWKDMFFNYNYINLWYHICLLSIHSDTSRKMFCSQIQQKSYLGNGRHFYKDGYRKAQLHPRYWKQIFASFTNGYIYLKCVTNFIQCYKKNLLTFRGKILTNLAFTQN